MRQASLYQAFTDGQCEIHIETTSGKKANLTLYEGILDLPVIVLPLSSNGCIGVYDYDVDFQLLKIDVSQPFQPMMSKLFVKSIVRNSSCKFDRVENGDTATWEAARIALQQLPAKDYKKQAAGFNLLFCTARTGQQTLVEELKKYSYQGYPEGF